MSNNVLLVNSVRGLQHIVTTAHEDELEEIYVFFERLRPNLPRKPRDGRQMQRTLRLPQFASQQLRDWFVPRGVNNPTWVIENDSDEQLACKYITALYKLGIPTFFREEPHLSRMKLFMSMEAYWKDSFSPGNDVYAASFRKERFIQNMATAMCEAFMPMFRRSSNLVAVFDASGHSATVDRWKLSLRICFVEIAVELDTARRARDALIRRLGDLWPPESQDGWTMTLDAISQKASEGICQDVSKFWECVVDDRIFHRNAEHRLVWCDTVHTIFELPEDRPLVPYALLHVKVQPDGHAIIDRTFEEGITDSDWMKLGSSWTTLAAPTELCNVRAPKSQNFSGQLMVSATYDEKPQAADTVPKKWIEYRTVEDVPYYFNSVTAETVWQLPNQWWACKADNGDTYYHNPETNETKWQLPPGAELMQDMSA